MQTKISSYKDLIVWQKAIVLVIDVYSITKDFPAEEKFNLTSQINRATVSVPSNIAEGYGRNSAKNYIQFLRISRGSLQELETLLIISKELNYINQLKFETILNALTEVHKLLNGLIKKLGSSDENV